MSAPAQALSQLRLVLLGLGSNTVAQLVSAMPEHTAFVQKDLPANGTGCHRMLDESAGNIVFCPPQFPLLPDLIAASRLRRAPVIVVAEHPTEKEWLDVLDAGACDYIAPPFDSIQMRWMLDVCLSRPSCDGYPLPVQTSSASC